MNDPRTHEDFGRKWNEKWIYLTRRRPGWPRSCCGCATTWWARLPPTEPSSPSKTDEHAPRRGPPPCARSVSCSTTTAAGRTRVIRSRMRSCASTSITAWCTPDEQKYVVTLRHFRGESPWRRRRSSCAQARPGADRALRTAARRRSTLRRSRSADRRRAPVPRSAPRAASRFASRFRHAARGGPCCTRGRWARRHAPARRRRVARAPRSDRSDELARERDAAEDDRSEAEQNAPAAFASASSARPSSTSCQVSSPNAENVVKPPSTPVTSASRAAGEIQCSSASVASTPIAKQPVTFTANVPHGNPGPVRASTQRPSA